MPPISEITLKAARNELGDTDDAAFRRGFRQQFLVGLAPLNRQIERFAGEAFTLRFIPRGRIATGISAICASAARTTATAIEQIGAGQVLVIDSRGDTRAASGSMLLTRLWRKEWQAPSPTAFRDGTKSPAWRSPPSALQYRHDAPGLSSGHRHPAADRLCRGRRLSRHIVGDADGVVIVPRAIAEGGQGWRRAGSLEAFLPLLMPALRSGAPPPARTRCVSTRHGG